MKKGKSKPKIQQHKNVQGVQKSKKQEKVRLRAEESNYIDSSTSRKILLSARKQYFECNADEHHSETKNLSELQLNIDIPNSQNKVFQEHVTEDDFHDVIDISEEDRKALEKFASTDKKKSKTLADIISEKIAEKQNDLEEKLTDELQLKIEDVDPRIKEMYEGVRDIMKNYRSGKVPKAFKVIPKLKNWEQILLITDPFKWSAAAMFQAVRIFSSALSQNMAQRFYYLVLLPRIRDDLSEYKRLNMHLYNALKKALFKPAAFMKGIILPLLESGDCTLREAIIFGSVIARNTVPILHSCACLLKICEMEYTGTNSILIRIFLDKRYALPYRVVDAAVFHFLRFQFDKREMPVLWHQSLLTFVQRYKNDISTEQKECLFALLKKQIHPKITPEIRRELQAAVCRDIEGMDTEPIDSI